MSGQTSIRPIDDSNTVMSFGKYKGKAIFELLAEDPEYLEWAHENTERFKLSPRLMAEVRRKISDGIAPEHEDREDY